MVLHLVQCLDCLQAQLFSLLFTVVPIVLSLHQAKSEP